MYKRQRYIDKVRWSNETRYIDSVINKIVNDYFDKILWINKTIQNMLNETCYMNKTRWHNETRYVNKVRWTNKTRYIDEIVEILSNVTAYEDSLDPALIPDISNAEEANIASSGRSEDCSEWDTRDYVLIIIIAVVAVAWCIKETIEFFDCRMRKKNPVQEGEIFTDAELPPMVWEVKTEDIVKN